MGKHAGRLDGMVEMNAGVANMKTKIYLDFDLLIEKQSTGYQARVLNSPAGQASHEFSLPFSELELENFLLRIGQRQQGMRRMESPAMEAAKQFGGRLFQALFAGELKSCLQSSLDEASYRNAGLRIRLRLSGAPDLLDIPWEFLYNAALNRFLLLSIESPLVRYLDLPRRVDMLKVTPPLRILVMIASPSDCVPLDVEHEWRVLKQAVAALEASGLLVLDRLTQATLAALQKQLQRVDYHIFHFIGHGSYDAQAQDGVLLLEDEMGKGRPVSGQYLGMILHDEKTLRLAFLNSCEGGRTARSDPFAGVCQSLLQQGIPAVLAMQFAISDQAAITLAREFYTALAAGLPVDAALTEARKGIFADNHTIEWGTPVLYMRTSDGQIFDVASDSTASLAPITEHGATPRLSKQEWRMSVPLLVVLTVLVVSVSLWQLFGGNNRNPGDNPEQGGAMPSVAVLENALPTTDVPTIAPTPTDGGMIQTAQSKPIIPIATDTPLLTASPPTVGVTLPPTPTIPIAADVYSFDDDDGDGWFLDTDWAIVPLESGGGVLQVTASPDGWPATSLRAKHALTPDMALQLRIRFLQPTNRTGGDADLKLAIRANQSDPSGFEAYSLYISNHLQNILLRRDSLDGYAAGRPLGDAGFAWALNHWYTVRVEAKSSHIRIAVDGQELLTVEDNVLTNGFFYLTASPGTQIQFDEIRVEK